MEPVSLIMPFKCVQSLPFCIFFYLFVWSWLGISYEVDIILRATVLGGLATSRDAPTKRWGFSERVHIGKIMDFLNEII